MALQLLPIADIAQKNACVLAGDKTNSRTAYQNFFASWKDADPDIPALKEAKLEYARLEAN